MSPAPPALLEVAVDGPARAVFTTRLGGVSVGPPAGLNLGAEVGDEDGAVRANRGLLAAALGIDPDRVTMGRQVHGALVREVAAPTRPGRFTGGLRGWPEGDGLATGTPGLPLLVLGADCVPVLLWRRDARGCAAAHAGWRGLVAGVVGAAVRALGEPGRIGAAVGPAVGPCCYPVDAALRDRFAARFGPETVRPPAVDLAGAARLALIGAGVPASAIQVHEACTSCEPGRFFSHRRDGAGAGRQAGLVWAIAEPAG
ncbi:MAG: purine-nucleoside/S-methyl-5-thioadenosine phosphorylase / adenosine deaminase [Miltoncostaeaceae bacterium]|jgi:YfiH family protein|nr:purine-nucleoside/S-methyl-5-thioadenosine phosphorylase / adenosine deaminase [Miltoncostaeaceae bacterium]